jgi:hypothetical protein
MHENNEEPLKCKAMADDYLECLHHRKYVSKHVQAKCSSIANCVRLAMMHRHLAEQ